MPAECEVVCKTKRPRNYEEELEAQIKRAREGPQTDSNKRKHQTREVGGHTSGMRDIRTFGFMRNDPTPLDQDDNRPAKRVRNRWENRNASALATPTLREEEETMGGPIERDTGLSASYNEDEVVDSMD